MLKGRHKFEDEDEIYIPDLGDGGFSDDFNLHDRTPRSNAGIGLGWSDLLLINRFNTDSHDMLDEEVRAVTQLIETFDAHEIARVCGAAMLAVQLALIEEKNFGDEYQKYVEYIKKHPEDVEE